MTGGAACYEFSVADAALCCSVCVVFWFIAYRKGWLRCGICDSQSGTHNIWMRFAQTKFIRGHHVGDEVGNTVICYLRSDQRACDSVGNNNNRKVAVGAPVHQDGDTTTYDSTRHGLAPTQPESMYLR